MTTTAMPTPTTAERIAQLDAVCDEVWARIKATRYYAALMAGQVTPGVLHRYLAETYFYVRENAKNQAAIVLRLDDKQADYAKYCLKHALEENSHEQMCLHDLRTTGFDLARLETLRPLPATAGFIAFLYHWADHHNPIGRLGYSYWAEGAHSYLQEGMAKVKQMFALSDNQMTFFVAHAAIDEKHFKEVKDALAAFCQTEQDWADVAYCIRVTGTLTAHMLDEILEHPLD